MHALRDLESSELRTDHPDFQVGDRFTAWRGSRVQKFYRQVTNHPLCHYIDNC